MANSAMVHARVDAQTKSQAQGVLNKLGMTLSEAISLYLRQIVFRKGIPFEVKIPNELTIEKSERGQESGQTGQTGQTSRTGRTGRR